MKFGVLPEWRRWLFGLSLGWLILPMAAQDWRPTERTDQSWRIVSLLRDADLQGRTIWGLDFERGTNTTRRGATWLATSDGLREYDGYTWRRHGRDAGLPSDTVRCVKVTESGEVWVGTDHGVAFRDGRTFRAVGAEAGLSGAIVREIVDDPAGMLWFCSTTPSPEGAVGRLVSLQAGRWQSFGRESGLPEGPLLNLFPDRAGRRFALATNGLFLWADRHSTPITTAPADASLDWGSAGIAETAQSGWVCWVSNVVFRLGNDGWRRQSTPFDRGQGVCATEDGQIVGVNHVADGRSAFVEWQTNGWVRASADFTVLRDDLNEIREAPDGSVWGVGAECLVLWLRRSSQWTEYLDLPPPLFADASNGVWFGRSPAGKTRPLEIVRQIGTTWERLDSAIAGLSLDRKNHVVWTWTAADVTRWSGALTNQYPLAVTGLHTPLTGGAEPSGAFSLVGKTESGALAVATADSRGWRRRDLPDFADVRWWTATSESPGAVWFGGDRGPGRDGWLVRIGSETTERIPVPESLIGSSRVSFVVDSQGTPWLFGDRGLHRWHPAPSRTWERVETTLSDQVLSGVVRGEELWFACAATHDVAGGLVCFQGGRRKTLTADVRGPLDVADDGTLVWGVDAGLQWLGPDPNAKPVMLGYPAARRVTRALKNARGQYWAAAENRTARFKSDGAPPHTSIAGLTRVFIDERFDARAEAIERFRQRDPRRDALFSWRLNQGPWSVPTTDPTYSLVAGALPTGTHRLEVRAIDAGGDEDPIPAELAFRVLPIPIQGRPWFLLLTGGVVALLCGLAVTSLNARRRLAEYAQKLEERVALRTAESHDASARRKEAELAVQKGEDRFAKAFQASPVIAAISTFPEGRYLEINREFTGSLGYEREEVLGRTAIELGVWARPEQRDAILTAMANGERVHAIECLLRSKSGDLRTVLTSVERIELAGRSALLFASVDITVRKRAEEALRHSDDRLRLALTSSRTGVWEWDVRARRLFSSPECQSIAGYAGPLDDLGKVRPLVTAEDAETIVAGVRQALNTGEEFASEFRLVRADGRWIWVATRARAHYDTNGEATRLIGTLRDITEERRSTMLLTGQKVILEMIATGAPLRETLETLLRLVEAQSPEAYSSILLLDAEGRRLHHGAAPRLPTEYVTAIDGFEIGPTAGSCGSAAFRRERVVVTDIATDPLWENFRAKALPHGLRSCWSNPIHDMQGNVLGTFAIYYRRPQPPADDDLRLVDLVTGMSAIAILRDRAKAALAEREAQLRLFVEHAPAAIAMLDRGLRYLAASNRWRSEFGFLGQEWLGRGQDEISPQLPLPWDGIRRRCLEGGVERADEDLCEDPDGTVRWLRWEAHPWYTAEDMVGGVIVFSEDITRRKVAEAAIQERLNLEQRLARMAATVPGAIFAFQLRPDGVPCFPYASPQITSILGIRPEDVRDDLRPGLARVHPEDLPGLDQSIRTTVAAGVAWQRVFRFLHPSKGLVWIEGRSEPTRQEDGSLIYYGWLMDVTERRRSEQRRATEHAVTRVLAQAQSIAEASPAILRAICEAEGWEFGTLWEIDPSLAALRCVEAWSEMDPSFKDIQDASRTITFTLGEGLPGRVWASGETMVVPDIAADPGFLRAHAAHAAGLRSAVGFPVEAEGRLIGVIDFLSRERIEPTREIRDMLAAVGSQIGQFIARKTTQERLQRFVALSPAVLYALRVTPSGLRFLWASDNIREMTGYGKHDRINGDWWLEHLHPEDRDRVLAISPVSLPDGHQVLEFRFRRRDGTYIWIRDEKRLIRDSKGSPAEIVGVWLDITERMRLEAQLRQAQKMEAIGLLSGGIAHDFNNLLGAITSNVELARLDIPAEHPATESLDEILTASRRAAALVRQILAFARREPREQHHVDLRSILAESVRLLRAAIPAGIDVSCRVLGNPPAVLADETQIQQAIVNLGTNAWHALTDAQGRISIELAAVDVDATQVEQNPDLKVGRYARLRVRDTGVGMDAATMERIFDPFFTTKPVGKGTGLGLSVVHGIVRSHGGGIRVTSAPGQGSTFDLLFPEAAPAPTPAPAPPRPVPPASGKRIFIVDDEEPLAKATVRALERLGYVVQYSRNPLQALERFRADPQAFDLVLTDLNMPGTSGLELAKAFQELRPDLPILLATGFLTDDVRHAAEAAGVRGILRKPSTLQELGEAIVRALPAAPDPRPPDGSGRP